MAKYKITSGDFKLYISNDNRDMVIYDTKYNVYHWLEVQGGCISISGNLDDYFSGVSNTKEVIQLMIAIYKDIEKLNCEYEDFDVVKDVYNQDEYKELIKSSDYRLIGNNTKVPSSIDIITITDKERIELTRKVFKNNIYIHSDTLTLGYCYGTILYYSDRRPVRIVEIVNDLVICLELKIDGNQTPIKNEYTGKVYTLKWNDKFNYFTDMASCNKNKLRDIGHKLEIGEPRYFFDLSF